MSKNPKLVGENSEGQVLAALLRANKVVLQPFGDSQRYDLVVDEQGVFLRIQCKTGHLEKGAVTFSCCSLTWSGKRKPYHGEADLFGVYCPELDKVFLVPVAEVGSRRAALRYEAPRNNQVTGIREATAYELAPGKILTRVASIHGDAVGS